MRGQFERRLARIESRTIGNPFDGLSDDELSALIEAVKEHIADDDEGFVPAVAAYLNWPEDRVRHYLHGASV